MTSPSTEGAPDLIPLAAAAVALGITPASAQTMNSRGRLPVPVRKSGRYNVVAREDVLAELKRRPHITREQHQAIIKAHEKTDADVSVSPSDTEKSVADLLAHRRWLSTSEAARALGLNQEVLRLKIAARILPIKAEKDPDSTRGAFRISALDVAAFLAAQEPSWPSAEDFAAVPTLDLAEVKLALGDDTPAGADDPTTQAYLQSRETISLADFALMKGINPEALKYLVKHGKVETVEDPAAKGGTRKLRRIRSEYAAAQLRDTPADE